MNLLEKTKQILLNGTEELIGFESVTHKLENNIPLTIKAGFDPTKADLHLGHAVLLFKLKQLQDIGHEINIIIGDFTASIGDPTGKNVTRKQLSLSETSSNGETYAQQSLKILSPETKIFNNSTWLNKLSSIELIKLSANYTVARMLERDDFKKRFKSNNSISIHEFMYPLLQGYDSVILKSDIELGGTDQKFNLLVGRQLQKNYKVNMQAIATLPIIPGTDGKNKMSKSLDNHISLTLEASEMFAKIMSINDIMMWEYYIALGFKTKNEVSELKIEVENGLNPRDVKIELALKIVSTLHSETKSKIALENFINRFQKKQTPKEIKTIKLEYKDNYFLVNLIKDTGLVASTSQVRRLIKQGAVRVNSVKIQEVDHVIKANKTFLLEVGKKNIINIAF